MELSEEQKTEKYAKLGGHCLRNTLLPYEYAFSCILCGFNLIKRKHELSKKQRETLSID